jgi:hypothetical protein
MSREMPNAVSLEQSVLGSLMVYPKVIQDCQELDLCRRILFAFSSTDLSGYLYNS